MLRCVSLFVRLFVPCDMRTPAPVFVVNPLSQVATIAVTHCSTVDC